MTLALGTMTMGWQNNERQSVSILDVAYAAGINFMDTADIYSNWVPGNPGGVSEQIIGRWLKTKSRDSVYLATKCRGRMWDGADGEGLSRAHIFRACNDSLRRLQTDYIDLYQCHSPDENTPIEETVEALHELVKTGKVRALGVSNFPEWLHRQANDYAKQNGLTPFTFTQPKYNLICRRDFEGEYAPYCAREKIGVIPYSPLEGGLLTGKYKPGATLPENSRHTINGRAQEKMTPRVVRTLAALEEISRQRGETMTQTALAWLNSKPYVTAPIIGATSIEQLNDSMGALNKKLTSEEVQNLDEVSSGL
jgi:aryl-alcohol dehydrogenase-like predicted oxidoreductase